MASRNTVARSLHDIGLAAWFGGSLMGAVGVNGAAAQVDDPAQRARVASSGWGRWTPVNALAIGAHLVGAAQLTQANKGRLKAQKGVAGMSAAKTALTAAALAATAYSRVLGGRVMKAGDVPVAGGTDPLPQTPPEVANAQRQLTALQWVIPALTGGMLGVNAYAGEQQRPMQVVKGVFGRVGQLAATGVLGAAKPPRKNSAAKSTTTVKAKTRAKARARALARANAGGRSQPAC